MTLWRLVYYHQYNYAIKVPYLTLLGVIPLAVNEF